MDKRKRELIQLLKKYGYELDGVSGSAHRKAVNRRTGHKMNVAMSPKDSHTQLKQIERCIKRYG